MADQRTRGRRPRAMAFQSPTDLTLEPVAQPPSPPPPVPLPASWTARLLSATRGVFGALGCHSEAGDGRGPRPGGRGGLGSPRPPLTARFARVAQHIRRDGADRLATAPTRHASHNGKAPSHRRAPLVPAKATGMRPQGSIMAAFEDVAVRPCGPGREIAKRPSSHRAGASR